MKRDKTLFKMLPILFLALFLSISCVSAAEDTNTDQTENNLYSDSCGTIALQKTLKTQGIEVTATELAKQSGTDDKGTTMQGMIKAAKQNGAELYGVESEANKLQKNDIALLKTIEGNHYTVITEINKETITLHNPPETITLNKFKEVYSGYTLTTKTNQGRLLNPQELQTIKGEKGFRPSKGRGKGGKNGGKGNKDPIDWGKIKNDVQKDIGNFAKQTGIQWAYDRAHDEYCKRIGLGC